MKSSCGMGVSCLAASRKTATFFHVPLSFQTSMRSVTPSGWPYFSIKAAAAFFVVDGHDSMALDASF